MNRYNPLVTVYITNFNYGLYIRQAIESVLNQIKVDFELIIIDDGSTDNSRELIEEYRSHPLISIIYQQNQGLNITNNIAMRAAQGKYIMRLDADDFLQPNALSEMSSVLEQDDQLGLVFPDYFYVDAKGNITGEERRHNFDKEVSLYDQPAHGACTMIRLSFLRDLGGYNESFTCQDGYDLWIKFIMHHKVTNVNQPLFSYRRHGNNLTTNEHRILSTRKKIKELFVEQHFSAPSVLVVIPVRSTFIGSVNYPLLVVGTKSILQHKVDVCVAAKRLGTIIISTSDQEIVDHCKTWIHLYQNVFIVERPLEFAKSNESLSRTIEQAIAFGQERNRIIEAVMTVSLEYPFLTADVIDDAVNTLTLFRSDAVLSVRPDNRMYYQHTGHSLRPILDQDKFTKLEREAIYRGAGGVVLATLKSFEHHKKLTAGTISHIVVDEKTAFGVYSQFDLEMINLIFQNQDVQAAPSTNWR